MPDDDPIPSRTTGVFVLAGCSQAKQDTDAPIPACELYDSVYWDKKRAFAEAAVGWSEQPTAAWTILSAEHAILPPMMDIASYDTTITDLRGEPLGRNCPYILPNGDRITTQLDWWAHCVRGMIIDWLRAPFRADQYDERRTPCGELLVLVGDRYLEPLRERDIFTGRPESIHTDEPAGTHTIEGLTRVRYAFQERAFEGIGDQMHWLTERAAALQVAHDRGQAALERFGGGSTHECPHWQRGRSRVTGTATEQVDLSAFENPPDSYIATEHRALEAYRQSPPSEETTDR